MKESYQFHRKTQAPLIVFDDVGHSIRLDK